MKTFRAIFLILLFLAMGALAVFYFFTHDIPVIESSGMIGKKERDLIITAAILMLIVVIPVFILTLFIAIKYRETNTKAVHAPDWEHNNIAEVCWWGVPLVIIVILAVITYKSSHELNPFKPIVNGKRPIKIQVIALQWKWLFIYPEEGIATINYVQFPEQTPLDFEISADAPMNSFWIPALGGMIYAMPAMRSQLHLIANHVGTFRGVSANISGSGFAGMTFTAKSTTKQEFDSWVQSVKSSSKHLGIYEYNHQLVPPSEYVPIAYYTLAQDDLFDQILMKYSPPKAVGH